jgi:hypothetical protein
VTHIPPQLKNGALFGSNRPEDVSLKPMGQGVGRRPVRDGAGWGFVPHIWPRKGLKMQESWSEWQDLNLRPPRPERDVRQCCLFGSATCHDMRNSHARRHGASSLMASGGASLQGPGGPPRLPANTIIIE